VISAAACLVAVAATLPSLPTTNPLTAHHGGSSGTASGGANGATGSNAPGTSNPAAPGVNGTAPGAAVPGAAAGAGTAPRGAAGAGPAVQNGCNTYQGVSCNAIQVAFHWYDQGPECPGDQNLGPFLKTLGVHTDPEASIGVLVQYFNAHSHDIFSQLPSGQPGFYGRQIAPHLYKSDGGPFCGNVNKQAAVQMATDGNFAAIGGCITCGSEGSGDVIQSVLAQYHVNSYEPTWNTNAYYANRNTAPYAWGALTSGDTIVQHLSSVICNAYVGRPASDTGDGTVTGKSRVFSIANIDEPEENTLGDRLIGNIRGCGATIASGPAGHVEYAKDTSTASQQAANIEYQQRSAGVTTIVCVCDAIAALVGNTQDASTHWYPEYLVSDFGFLDSPTAVYSQPPAASKNVVAVAETNEYDESTQPFCATPYGKIWCAVKGKAQPPEDFALWWVVFRVFIGQIAGAGANLSPQTIYDASVNGCAPCAPAGDSRPYDPQIGFGPKYPDGQYSAWKDYTLVRWDPNATSPWLQDIQGSGAHGAFVPYNPATKSASLGWSRWRSWGVRTK